MASNKPLNLIEGGNLNVGSRGSSVSQMQQILKQFGYYPGPIDGVFGPQTRDAVKMFQTDTGITRDGIFGPVTQSKLLDWQANPLHATVNDPIVKDAMAKDPNLAQSLAALQQEGGNRANFVASAAELGKRGYYLGNNFTVDPQKMQMFYDAAKKELDPAWNEQLQFYQNDFRSALEKEKADYQDQLEAAEQKFGTDRFELQNQQGPTNNVNSSLGARQRENLVNDYNRNLSGLERNTTYKLSDLARSYENKLGTNDVNNFRTSLPTSNVGWWSGPQRGSTQAFNPMGNQQGSLREQYASQVEQYGKKKAQEFYNPLYR